ncbi:uncharacterized protein LOC127264798 [Andrographis paniculata]|uniref:uncharacterized protein LOC127264798 n=1 Tax=Andrographis paniculata TaxID=175694 RepID=UPI0021E916BF|nr:uncharacterized protein LOC127264798 [Andrographis paniculata]
MGEPNRLTSGTSNNLPLVITNHYDPMYVHPSDYANASLISCVLTGCENFVIWNKAMTIALKSKNKLKFVEGKVPMPSDPELAEKWSMCNALIMSWLLNSVDKSIYRTLVFYETTSEMWNDIKNTYESSSGASIYAVLKEIANCKQGNDNVNTYYTNLKQLWDHAASIKDVERCVYSAKAYFDRYEQTQHLVQFLMGLSDRFFVVRSTILAMSPPPSVKEAFNIVSQEESHKKICGDTILSKNTGPFIAKRSIKSNAKNPNLKCSHCGRTGHLIERCYQLIGYPDKKQGFKINKSATASVNSSSVENVDDHMVSNRGLLFYVELVKNGPIHVVLPTGKTISVAESGHSSVEVSNLLRSELGLSSVPGFICDVCHRAKQTRTPFPLSTHKSKAMFELIHGDVWGPYHVETRNGFKRFLTLVDDFSRATWVFMLKSKSEVFTCLKEFFVLIKNQFDKTVKIFRSDNGTEFVNSYVTDIFKRSGIVHQTSFVYSPQQNGVVERKHRHILNVASALMFQSNCPPNFWGDNVLAAVHIINRLPTPLLGRKSPYQINSNQGHLGVASLVMLRIKKAIEETSNSHTSPHKVVHPIGAYDDFLEVCKGNLQGTPLDEIQDISLDQQPGVTLDGNTNHPPEPTVVTENCDLTSEVYPNTRQSSRKRHLPSYLHDYQLSIGSATVKYPSSDVCHLPDDLSRESLCLLANLDKVVEPQNVKETILNPKWKEAMDLEMKALIDNKTWVLS